MLQGKGKEIQLSVCQRHIDGSNQDELHGDDFGVPICDGHWERVDVGPRVQILEADTNGIFDWVVWDFKELLHEPEHIHTLRGSFEAEIWSKAQHPRL